MDESSELNQANKHCESKIFNISSANSEVYDGKLIENLASEMLVHVVYTCCCAVASLPSVIPSCMLLKFIKI